MVHPSAFVHPKSQIAFDAKICAGAVIGPDVKIGRNVVVGAYSVIGTPPEHRGFYDDQHGTNTKGVELCDGARIFEFVTIHAGTLFPTTIGPKAAVFNHSHIAHDVELMTGVTVGGHVSIAGHVVVQHYATISGKSAIHQHCVIGPYAFLGAASYLKGHVPPGELWLGNPARPAGANEVGIKRGGYVSLESCQSGWNEIFENARRNSKL